MGPGLMSIMHFALFHIFLKLKKRLCYLAFSLDLSPCSTLQ